ncbi:MAG: phosphatase PAP2 family protein [Caulobacteraceae bacterium]|nr:phosphatase PAP2 family protein [Caulobacteraceae bacterium]
MSMRPLSILTAVCATVLVCSAASADAPVGYLPAHAVDAARVVGPPPAEGSPELAADQAIYRAAEAGAGSERWRQAREDDSLDWPVVLDRYACALDARLNVNTAPATLRLLERVKIDVDATGHDAKSAYGRLRPFVTDRPDAPICIDIPPERRPSASPSYPSGHATLGTTWGLVLSEAAPDRTGAIAERTRAFIDSRRVCRLHYASDLRAGERLGASIFARLQSSPDFQADLAAARAEIAAAPKPQGCAAP